MYRNIKIKVEKTSAYEEAIKKHLVDMGHKGWTGWSGKFIFIRDNGYIEHGYSDIVFNESLKKEMKLVETVSYRLEAVREKICIGEKSYYLDELEVALKNIKPIENA